MTTKKQRRQAVAERRATYDAETKRMGLAALAHDREQKERKTREATEAALAKKNAADMKMMARRAKKAAAQETQAVS